MKLFFQCLILIFFCFNLSDLKSQNLQFEWKKEIPSNGNGIGNSIKTDSHNNCYVAGNYENEIQINNSTYSSLGNNDGLLIKIDEDGMYVWIKEFKSSNDVNITSIAIDEDEYIYITGDYDDYVEFDTTLYSIHPQGENGSTMFISKFNVEGDLEWARNTGGISSLNKNKLIIDNEGDIIVSSKAITIDQFGNENLNLSQDSIWVTWDMGNPYWSYFYQEYSVLAKYSKDGEFIWCKQSGGSPTDLKTDSENNIILTGYVSGLPQEIYGDDNYIYGDSILTVMPITSTSFLSKYDSNGELIWLELLTASPSAGRGNALEVDSLNNIYLTGQIGNGTYINFGENYFSDNSLYHAFIIKYSPSKEVIWVKDIGTPEKTIGLNNVGTSLAINSQDELIYAGIFADTLTMVGNTIASNRCIDMMIMKLDLDGEILDVGQYVRYGCTIVNQISLGYNDEIFFTGLVDEWNSAASSQILIGKIDNNLLTPILETIIDRNINIFPTPASVNQNITIKLEDKFENPWRLLISDVNGKPIINKIINESNYNFRIKHEGYFIISIIENNKIYSKMIFVTK